MEEGSVLPAMSGAAARVPVDGVRVKEEEDEPVEGSSSGTSCHRPGLAPLLTRRMVFVIRSRARQTPKSSTAASPTSELNEVEEEAEEEGEAEEVF